ncbi:unnamed protein product [Musa acuminata var. zebrina]
MYTVSAAIRDMHFISWHKNQLGFAEVGAEGTHTKPLCTTDGGLCCDTSGCIHNWKNQTWECTLASPMSK